MHESISLIAKQTLFGCLILTISIVILSSCSRYDVPTPENWSDGIKVTRTMVTEAQTVEDWKSMSTLFTYYDFPMAQPLIVQAIDEDRWVVIFEKPSMNRANSDVSVERIGENEYRIVIKPEKSVGRP